MRRVSGFLIISVLLLLVYSPGCKEEVAATETGMNISTTNCLTFGIWIFVDEQYQGMISSEESHFLAFPAGTYVLTGRSNANLGNTYFCWTTEVTVRDGAITQVILDCDGAECID